MPQFPCEIIELVGRRLGIARFHLGQTPVARRLSREWKLYLAVAERFLVREELARGWLGRLAYVQSWSAPCTFSTAEFLQPGTVENVRTRRINPGQFLAIAEIQESVPIILNLPPLGRCDPLAVGPNENVAAGWQVEVPKPSAPEVNQSGLRPGFEPRLQLLGSLPKAFVDSNMRL